MVGGGYCWLQMPLSPMLAVGRQWLGIGWAPWRWGRGGSPPSNASLLKRPPHAHTTFPKGMLRFYMWAHAAITKAQKEIWLVSGLTDHTPLSQEGHRDASGQTTNMQSNGAQRYVKAATTGSPPSTNN